MSWRKFAIVVFAVIAIGPPGPAWGQENLDPGQLPKSTMFYVAWHGTPSGEARKSNSLLALWDDADFAPVREAVTEQMLSESSQQAKRQAKLTREELADIASLLDNGFVVGYLSDPTPAKGKSASPPNPARKWQGGFMVYDRTGKEATLAKLMIRSRMNDNDAAKMSTVTLAGIPAMKMERQGGTTYWAENGKYAYGASEPAVFKQILAWTKHETPQSGWLSKTAAYQEAGGLLHGGVLEFFVHFPALKDLATDASPGGFRLGPLLQNLRIDAVHSVAGRLELAGARTRIQGAVLGDSRAGTLFDIWGDAVATPVSAQLVNENTVSYQSTQINLTGIYGLIKHAMQSAGNGGQQGPIDFVETAAKTRLGMPLADALAVFSGEFASVQSSAAFDAGKQVYFVGIRKKPEALKILRAALAERLSGERNEGDVTFFRVSEGGLHSDAGTAEWKYYHVALTPEAILVARRSDALREALATRKSRNLATIGMPKRWEAARAQFPPTLEGLGIVDLQKVDWAAVKNPWSSDRRKSAAKPGVSAKTEPRALENALTQLDPQVFQRHLHLSSSASWKDAHGLHLDGWIE